MTFGDVFDGKAQWTCALGDCREELAKLPDNSVHACVCDPPYELGFMGKRWDATGIAYDVGLWREVLRVLKPGGHLLAFGGTRTYHRMACAIEDAGLEIRDSLHWIYGTGFPKSLDVSKAIDGAAGAEREVIGANPNHRPISGVGYEGVYAGGNTGAANVTAPATDAAKQWQGYGTALKPAHEPIVMARKPLIGTVAANILAHGTGGLNIDGCRIGESKRVPGSPKTASASAHTVSLPGFDGGTGHDPNIGRFPANVLFDEAAAAELDAQSGQSTSPGKTGRGAGGNKGRYGPIAAQGTVPCPSDSGGASRFFFVAKPARSERNNGCEALPAKSRGEATGRKDGSPGEQNPRAGAGSTFGAKNFHPTVKPVELMQYLVRLVTPPGCIVLDPFAGSATCGVACLMERLRYIGIEREATYHELALARLAGFRFQFAMFADAKP